MNTLNIGSRAEIKKRIIQTPANVTFPCIKRGGRVCVFVGQGRGEGTGVC